MYAFKVIVSTLIVLMICLLGFAANKGGGKLIATLTRKQQEIPHL